MQQDRLLHDGVSNWSESLDLSNTFARNHSVFEHLCGLLVEYDKKMHERECRQERAERYRQPGTSQMTSSYLCFIMGINKTFRSMVTTLNVYFLQACGVHKHELFASNHLMHVKTIVFSRSVLNRAMDYLDFFDMSRRWLHLSELRLDYCHDVGTALRAFAQTSPGLKRLSLRYCKTMNHHVQAIQSFASLSDLIVDGSDISAKTYQQLLNGAPHLRISMQYCANLEKKKNHTRAKQVAELSREKTLGFCQQVMTQGLSA